MEHNRRFNGTDAFLIESANTFQAMFVKDIAEFSMFDTKLNLAYATEFKAAIYTSLSFGTDETLGDVMAGYTKRVLETMKKCQLKYAQMKYFAEKAFPNKKPAQDEFGTRYYRTARNKQDAMIVFMTALSTVAEKYKVQIFAEGATQAQIDEILLLRDELLATNNEQEVFIRARGTVTFDRISGLNNLYGYIETICQAAQIVNPDNDAFKGKYVYLPGTYVATRTKQGTASPGSSLVVKLSYRANRTIIFENTGTETLLFGLSKSLDGIEGTILSLEPNSKVSKRSDELFVDGKYVICTNNSNKNGAFKVEYNS